MRKPTLLESFVPLIFLTVLLSINVSIFGDDALSGSNQIVLILSTGVATLMSLRYGYNWSMIQKGIVRTISSAFPSIMILLVIGSLSGTWLLSGIVPAMIYYGLQIINPTFFLVAACLVCAIVSIATGSSWTTSATVGIALIGIGKTLGISEGLAAGAILSGAYFGDKMSPLSDTTNLAPAMAGTDLFTHIKYMTITTIPSFSITLIIFTIIGFGITPIGNLDGTQLILDALSENFSFSLWLLLVPASVIVLIIKKMPAFPALLIGALLGGLFALIFQPSIVSDIGGGVGVSSFFSGVMKSLYGNIAIVTDHELVNDLLKSGGMKGMLSTVWLIISAMMFGGVMEKTGMLKCIANAIISNVQSIGALISSTAATCIFFNVTASDQYLAIVVPGRMYAKTFKKKGLAPENLSRTLEDSGTVTSVLIPWNTCGAFHSSVLSVHTLTYLPYCFFNILSPLMTILVGYTGYKIKRIIKKRSKK